LDFEFPGPKFLIESISFHAAFGSFTWEGREEGDEMNQLTRLTSMDSIEE
jgi:hypothetical protein